MSPFDVQAVCVMCTFLRGALNYIEVFRNYSLFIKEHSRIANMKCVGFAYAISMCLSTDHLLSCKFLL